MKTLEKMLKKEFRNGVSHWCDRCHTNKKIESSYIKPDYVVVQHERKDVRIYEIKQTMLRGEHYD